MGRPHPHRDANGWTPPQRYDFVRTGLDYVPSASRRAYLHHLIDHVVAPGGRLIIGVHNLAEGNPLTVELGRWDCLVGGISRRPHAVAGRAYTIHRVDSSA